jgi:ORF6N domain
MMKGIKNETSLIMPVTPSFIERRIYLIRGQKVMLSTDLAELYQVTPGALIQAVKRNENRFPDDFLFQLSLNEATRLKSQIVISNVGRGGRRHAPYAFTELGVAMLSSVLNSDRAIQMNIFIMRAFVQLRKMLETHKDLAEKIEKLEKEQKEQGKDITAISMAVTKLLESKSSLKSAIGFEVN